MIGLDVSDRSVKVVQLSDRTPRRLISHCTFDVPVGVMNLGIIQDMKKMEEVLHKALEACSVSPSLKTTIVASIPETQSFLRVVELPTMLEDEVGEAIQWEVAQHIPFGLENVYVDWQPMGRLAEEHTLPAGKQETLVGAAQRKVVDPLYALFRSLGVDVGAFELESQALTRAVVSPDISRRQGVLIVDLGGASTNVVIYDHGAIRFTASLQKGSDRMRDTLPRDEIETVNAQPDSIAPEVAQSIEGKLSAMYQELVVEVRGIVEFYNGIDRRHTVREIILTGGGSNLPGLGQAFLRVFDNVHVQRGNPWVNVVSDGGEYQAPMTIGESVRYATAIGLALRKVLL